MSPWRIASIALRITGTCLIWMAYIGARLALVGSFDIGSTIVIPVALTGMLWGVLGGGMAGIAAIPIEVAIASLGEGVALDALLTGGTLVGALASVPVGLLIGWTTQRQRRARVEAKAAIQSTADAERSLRGLLDVGRDLLLHLDANGQILGLNKPQSGLFAKVPEPDAADVRTLLWPQVAMLVLDRMKRAIAQQSARGIEQTIDILGERSHLDVRAHPDGADGAYVVLRDITRFRRNEEALRVSKERFALAIQGAKDGMWDWNLRTGEVYWSHRWRAMLGLGPAELEGRVDDWLSRVHHRDRPRVQREVEETLRGEGSHYESEHRLRHRNGNFRWMLARGVTLRDAEGRVTRVAGSFTDITDRRQTAAINEKLALLEHATHAVGVGIAIVQPAGQLTGVSPTLTSMTQDWDSPDDWWAELQSSMEYPSETVCPTCGLPQHVGTAMSERLSPQGRIQVFEIVFTGHGHDVTRDQPAQVVLVRDITRRRVAEERLRRLNAQLVATRDQALAASRAKSTFLANMSHELRTPLNAIIGYTEMLIEDAEETSASDDDSLQNVIDLNRIRSAGTHLLRLIGGILDLSKIEAGKMELNLELFDVRELIAEAVTTVEPLVADKNNTLEVRCPKDIGAMSADVTKVRQILFNLLSNASKFTDEGRIELTVETRDVDIEPVIVFTVKDSGIGMSEAHIRRLFEEFYQADSSSTRRHGGTGLGLAISKRFCAMMGGNIAVESEPGVGSSFSVMLPRHVSASRSSPPKALSIKIPAPIAISRSILAVDDNRDYLEIITAALQSDRHQIITATNGAEALELARKHHPQVIVLDVVMPEMDGWSVLQELKTDPQLRNIPVVLLTCIDDKRLGYTMGAAEYITKPVPPTELRKTIDRLLTGPTRPVLVAERDATTRAVLCRSLQEVGWNAQGVDHVSGGEARLSNGGLSLAVVSLDPDDAAEMRSLESLPQDSRWASVPVVVVSSREMSPEERERLEIARRIVYRGSYNHDQFLTELRSVVTQMVGTPMAPGPR